MKKRRLFSLVMAITIVFSMFTGVKAKAVEASHNLRINTRDGTSPISMSKLLVTLTDHSTTITADALLADHISFQNLSTGLYTCYVYGEKEFTNASGSYFKHYQASKQIYIDKDTILDVNMEDCNSTFSHIDISAIGTFTYSVNGKDITKTVNFKTESTEFKKISVYQNSTSIPLVGNWQDSGTGTGVQEYRINGVFYKDLNYTVEYSFTIDVDGKQIPLTYKRSYSYYEGNPYNICPGNGLSRGLDPVIRGEDMTKYFSSGAIKITKTVTGLPQLRSYTFKIIGPEPQTVELKPVDFTNGLASKKIDGLTLGNYTITEDGATVEGYDLATTVAVNTGKATAGNKATFEVTANNTTDVSFTNSYTPSCETVSRTVYKVWDDENNAYKTRPKSIDVQLYYYIGMNSSMQPYKNPVTLSDGNTWSYTWSDLPKYINGSQAVYHVEEVGCPDGYFIASCIEKTDSSTLTNSLDTIDINVNKEWADNDNLYKNRPSSIDVDLFADNSTIPVKSLTLNDENGWTGKFENMPFYNCGKRIIYSVAEKGGPSSYTSSVITNSDYNFTLSNTLSTRDIEVNKVWNDSDNLVGRRPASVTVNLYRNSLNSQPVGSLTLNAANNWSGLFTNVPKYVNGSLVTYLVEEAAIPENYACLITRNNDYSFTLTNTLTTSSIVVNKQWIDSDDMYRNRPSSIVVKLYADYSKTPVASLILKAADGWTGMFQGIDFYKDGKRIIYSIAEEDVLNSYTSSITRNNDYSFTLTNTPITTSRTVTKVWSDNNASHASVTVQLYANGSAFGDPVTLSTDNKWSSTWDKLPEYADGKLISYTVKEQAVTGYTASYSEKDGAFTITNTYSDVPKTGDSFNYAAYIAICIASLLMAAGVIILRKRNNCR